MLMDLEDSGEVVAIRSARGKFSLIQMMDEGATQLGMELMPLTVVMPCGCIYEYDYLTFPEETKNCSCGNPEHKVVEYMLH